jgi:hypothetical protein
LWDPEKEVDMFSTGSWRTAREALEACRLGWTVRKEGLRTETGIDVPDQFAVVKEQSRQVLGVVGRVWKPVQPAEAADFLTQVSEGTDMTFIGGGEFQGGRKMFLQSELPGAFDVLPGDATRKRILFVTGYDGGLSTSVFDTAIRVC